MIIRKFRQVPLGERTSGEDICMFDGDLADRDRIKMSCGHAAVPENLYNYCLTKLNSCDLSFKCIECDEVWEFPEISKKADMTDDESELFSRKMTKVAVEQSDDIRQCPTCGGYGKRQDENNILVVCVDCKKQGRSVYTFCWECNALWYRGHNCETYKSAQKILNECERVTIAYSKIANVPKIRACPQCKTFIKHTGGCKTMTCSSPDCGHKFCFSCLKPGSRNGSLQCGKYDSKCEVAPIQKPA